MINIVSKSIDGGKWQSISVLLCAVIQYSAIIIISNNILIFSNLILQFIYNINNYFFMEQYILLANSHKSLYLNKMLNLIIDITIKIQIKYIASLQSLL